MIFAGAMFVLKASLPETFAPILLKARAKKLREETGDKNICTEQELFKIPFSQMLSECLIRPFRKSSYSNSSSAGRSLSQQRCSSPNQFCSSCRSTSPSSTVSWYV